MDSEYYAVCNGPIADDFVLLEGPSSSDLTERLRMLDCTVRAAFARPTLVTDFLKPLTRVSQAEQTKT